MLNQFSTWAPLLPLAAGALRRRNNIIWWYCLLSLATDLLTYHLREQHIKVSLPGNVFAMVEFLCILYFYKNKVFLLRNTLFYSLLTGGLIFFLVTTTQGAGWLKLNRIGISIFLFIYIALTLAGFYTLVKEQQISFIEQSSFFWINTAILLFAAGAFFMFLATANIRTSADRAALTQLWGTLFQVINILKNILLGIALIQKQER